MKSVMWRLVWLGIFVLATACGTPAKAQEIRIGIATEPTALDPLFRYAGQDEQIARHLFDTLILQDAHRKLTPALALSWRAVDATTWEFRLRPHVLFHDGSEFTAEDVVATLKRAPNVPGSPGSYAVYTRQITGIDIVDPLTIRLHTASPYPNMPFDLSAVWVISRKAEDATTEEFNNGRKTIGTGPFRMIEWVKGERLVIERNDRYWGPAPAWKRVTFRFIPNETARVAALLAHDVDFVEFLPPSVIADVKAKPDFRIAEAVSDRVLYLHLDGTRDVTPYATDLAGHPLATNPLKDLRVRRAISKAIDRDAIVSHVLDGLGAPAGQLISDGYFGASEELKPERADVEGAKRLLAEAGYPEGFGITLDATSHRYVNDQEVAIALGQMLSRAGIATKVETTPDSVLKARANNFELSLFMQSSQPDTGEASSQLRPIVATRGLHGWGQANRGRYSNARLDGLLEQAMAEMNDQTRERLLRDAMEMAIRDVAVIPLYFEGSAWAFRAGLAYEPRPDQFTLAQEITPAP